MSYELVCGCGCEGMSNVAFRMSKLAIPHKTLAVKHHTHTPLEIRYSTFDIRRLNSFLLYTLIPYFLIPTQYQASLQSATIYYSNP